MIQNYNPDYFPFDSLPELLKNVIHEISFNVQVPYSMVASSVLGTMSVAIQKYANVKRPNGLISPISIFTLTIAESGDRKSTVDKLLTKPVNEFEEIQREKYKSELESYNAKLAIWEQKHKHLISEIKKSIKKNTPTESLEDSLNKHFATKPLIPEIKRTLIKDVTPEAMIQSMNADGASLGLFSDEAIDVLAGRAMGNVGQINKLWDGSNILKHRISSGEKNIKDPRLTCSLMTQRKVFEEFIDRKDGEARKVGLLARFLISAPTSFQGFREVTDYVPEWNYLNVFYKTINFYLTTSVNYTNKLIIEFDQFARLEWSNACNQIEKDQCDFGMYGDIKDFASKFGENVARLSALIQLLCYNETTVISKEAMRSAISICDWYLQQAKSILIRPIQHSFLNNQDNLDASELYNFFMRYINEHPNCLKINIFDQNKCFYPMDYFNFPSLQIRKNEIYQLCPNKIRKDKARFNRALDQLIRCGSVILSDFCYQGSKKLTATINFYPHIQFKQVNSPL